MKKIIILLVICIAQMACTKQPAAAPKSASVNNPNPKPSIYDSLNYFDYKNCAGVSNRVYALSATGQGTFNATLQGTENPFLLIPYNPNAILRIVFSPSSAGTYILNGATVNNYAVLSFDPTSYSCFQTGLETGLYSYTSNDVCIPGNSVNITQYPAQIGDIVSGTFNLKLVSYYGTNQSDTLLVSGHFSTKRTN